MRDRSWSSLHPTRQVEDDRCYAYLLYTQAVATACCLAVTEAELQRCFSTWLSKHQASPLPGSSKPFARRQVAPASSRTVRIRVDKVALFDRYSHSCDPRCSTGSLFDRHTIARSLCAEMLIIMHTDGSGAKQQLLSLWIRTANVLRLQISPTQE